MRQLSGGPDPAASSVTFCRHCTTRPVYIQDGKGTCRIRSLYLHSPPFAFTAEHDFCGLRCSKAFRKGKENPASCRASSVPTTPSLCKLSACQRLAYVGPTGEPGEYCGNAHRLSVSVVRTSASAEAICVQ